MYTLDFLASKINGIIKGNKDIKINNIATLINARNGDISFYTNHKYLQALIKTKASVVLIKKEELKYCKTNAIVVLNPYRSLVKIMKLFNKSPIPNGKIHDNVIIDESVKIGKNVTIGPNVVINKNVIIGSNVYIGSCTVIENGTIIGNNTIIKSNVSIAHNILIGTNCIIHQNVVIGSDGFGNIRDNDGSWLKIPQLGRVIIEDNVEIGSGTTIDRGVIDNTVIKKGVRIDNLVQIAHNVLIGENTAIAALTAIAGSSIIGNNCLIGGQSAIAGHINICDNTIIGGASNVGKSINTPGMYYAAFEVKPRIKWGRFVAKLNKIDFLINKLSELEENIKKKEIC